MKLAKTVLAAAAMALACSAAFAADDKDAKGFNEMDKNSDGRLTRSEAAGNKDVLAKWKQMDANNDGAVTRTEYLKVMAKKDANTAKEKVAGKDDKSRSARKETDKERMGFNELDKNNDGKLSRAEAAGHKTLVGKWKELDTDNDGSLSRAEYLKEMAKQDTSKVRERVGKAVDNMKRDEASTGSTAQTQSQRK